jgi:hypothetical protein
MEPEPTLIGTDGVVEFHAEPAIDVNLTPVVLPWYPEDKNAIGFGHPLENLVLEVFGMLLETRNQRIDHLANRLMKFRLGRVLCDEVVHKLRYVFLQVHDVILLDEKWKPARETQQWCIIPQVMGRFIPLRFSPPQQKCEEFALVG